VSDKTYDSDDSSFSCDRFLPRVREVAKGLEGHDTYTLSENHQ